MGGDGIAARGPAYGMATIRVDGNDVLAVYNATKKARELAVSENRPVLIEAMTYRIGLYLTNKGLWSEQQEKEWKNESKKQVLQAFARAEKKLKPNWKEMFTEVYDEIPTDLQKQMVDMEKHVAMYKDQYPLKNYEQ